MVSSRDSEREEMEPDIFNNADYVHKPAGIIEKGKCN